jgi:TonB family protein
MPQSPMPEPDPSKPDLSATGVLRARFEKARFETDFEQLAARFATQGGGGLSPELSADLALEIVLNEMVEQACLTTGATGAAVALERDGEMVCRGSTGATAPELGSRLDADSGLSGECIRTRRTQRCNDVLTDLRVDLEASQRLGVRSVMVMPLLRDNELVGLFELFSSRPQAFGERDERTLEALAVRILNNMERAARPLPPVSQSDQTPAEPVATAEAGAKSDIAVSDIRENVSESPEKVPAEIAAASPRRGFDFVTWALRGAVLVCAILLGLLLAVHPRAPKAMVHPQPAVGAAPTGNAAAGNASAVGTSASAVSSSAANSPVTNPPAEAIVPAKADGTNAAVQPSNSAKGGEKAAPAGGLVVFENGKEIFRMPPARNESAQGQIAANPAASLQAERSSRTATSAEPDELIHRVEPEYPEAARQQGIEGAVVLNVQIGRDGAVQDVQVVSGARQLAQASINAVKQWRFKPRLVNGSPVPMQTKITLNFKLPQ